MLIKSVRSVRKSEGGWWEGFMEKVSFDFEPVVWNRREME